MSEINAQLVQDMVTHWLNTPVNGYLGSSYGCDSKSLLQNPIGSSEADLFIAKMKRDIPILDALPANSVNIYSEKIGNDKTRLIIQIGSVNIPINDIENPA